MPEARERITTEDDGPSTVNERLSTGGPGPEGQLDTVRERLSGSQDPEPEEKAGDEPAEPSEPPKKAAKKPSRKS
jgi:hypothetical protein